MFKKVRQLDKADWALLTTFGFTLIFLYFVLTLFG